MTYQHKRDACTKGTRQILMEKMMTLKKAGYDLIKSDLPEDEKEDTNPLGDTEEETENPEPDFEDYTPLQTLDFKPTEPKESIEKKKKKRNYIEFRKA